MEAACLILQKKPVPRSKPLNDGVNKVRCNLLICPPIKEDTVFGRGINLDNGVSCFSGNSFNIVGVDAIFPAGRNKLTAVFANLSCVPNLCSGPYCRDGLIEALSTQKNRHLLGSQCFSRLNNMGYVVYIIIVHGTESKDFRHLRASHPKSKSTIIAVPL